MENNVDNVRAQMRKGVLEYCILSILNRGEAYASSILETLKAANMIVVERNPMRRASRAITSLVAIFPKLTFAPNILINIAC